MCSSLKLAKAISEKKLKVADAVSACFDSIREHEENGKINAFINYDYDKALKKAVEVQKKLDKGENLSPLAGVPIGIKDNILTKDFNTSCASKMLSNYQAIYNASVIDKLDNAGLIVIGKLNMDEYGMGSSSESGIYGTVKNPWDLGRVAGGSSGGSAAAVASGELSLALGTDTGGSIRQPCAFCGVSGIKPTYGAVSRYGLIAYASSLDQIGPIGRYMEDCAALLEIISGRDEMDATCVLDGPYDFSSLFFAPQNGLKNVRIAFPVNYFEEGLDSSVKTVLLDALNVFKDAGAEIIDIVMPYSEYMIPVYYTIASAEASSNLSRYDGVKFGYRSKDAKTMNDLYSMSRNEGFGLEVKRRIMLGSFVLSSGHYDAYYSKASLVRSMIKSSYENIFRSCDLIFSPVAPGTAFKLGENIDDPLKRYMGDLYTVSANLAGLPAASIPCGFDEQGLPVGLQLIANAFEERKIISAAMAFQHLTDWHTRSVGAEL